MLNKSRAKLNDEQRSNSSYFADLGQSFDNILTVETECPAFSESFNASLARQNLDMKRLTQWNLEHISLRDEAFADSLGDYIGMVVEFTEYVRKFQQNEVKVFEKWRENYINSRISLIKKSFDEPPTKDLIKEKLADALGKDEIYIQYTKKFYLSFDRFLTECEHFYSNRSLEMKILMRSFVSCWKMYSQAVVATLRENIDIIEQMDGKVAFREQNMINGERKPASDDESNNMELVDPSLLPLAEYITSEQFLRHSLSFKEKKSSSEKPGATFFTPKESDKPKSPTSKSNPVKPTFAIPTNSLPPSLTPSTPSSLPPSNSTANLNQTTPSSARLPPPADPPVTNNPISTPPRPTPASMAPPPPAPTNSSSSAAPSPSPPPPPPPPPSSSTAIRPPTSQPSTLTNSSSSAAPPPPPPSNPSLSNPLQGSRGDLLRDIQKGNLQNLKKVPESEKNRRPVSTFESPSNPLEIGELFNQITGLRSKLGYGKKSGEQMSDDEDDSFDVVSIRKVSKAKPKKDKSKE